MGTHTRKREQEQLLEEARQSEAYRRSQKNLPWTGDGPDPRIQSQE